MRDQLIGAAVYFVLMMLGRRRVPFCGVYVGLRATLKDKKIMNMQHMQNKTISLTQTAKPISEIDRCAFH